MAECFDPMRDTQRDVRDLSEENAALKKENAELRRWLGAAAKLIEEPYWEPFEGALRGVSAHRTSSTFRALSRGEPVSEDVRRLYLGDEVSEE